MKKQNVLSIIAVATVILILAGMISATVILSGGSAKEWEYLSTEENIDYAGSDFEYLENFKTEIKTYFSALFSEFFSSYINLNGALQEYLNGIAERIVTAMSEARIPGTKLNKTAKALKNNSLNSVFGSLKAAVAEMTSIEELEAYLTDKLTNLGFIDLFGGFFSGLMEETALNENEIASVIYYLLTQNSNDNYLALLGQMGKETFVSLLSDTIYVLTTVRVASQSEYLLTSTADSLKEVFYQLGSLYSSLANLPGGGETVENIFGFTFDYEEENEIVNSYVADIKGKIGELVVIIGRVMKSLSADDVKTYCRYLAYENGKEKNDAKIYCAMKLSELLCEDVESITSIGNKNYSSVSELCNAYARVSSSLANLAFDLIYSVVEDEERGEPTDYTELFIGFAEASEALSKIALTEEEIGGLDENDEKYLLLLGYADDFFDINDALGGLCENLIAFRFADAVYPLLKQEAEKNE